jgi:hypothetical protein
MYMTSLIAYFGYEIKQINGPITWVQTRIRKRPQPAPMLGYGLIKRPKLGLDDRVIFGRTQQADPKRNSAAAILWAPALVNTGGCSAQNGL